MNTALVILRVVIGLYLFGHGAQKLFGWFGGYALRKTASAMGSMLGFRPALFWTAVAALGEAGGGALMVLGLLGPIGPLAAAATMVVATSTHISNGVWAPKGVELPLMYLVVAVVLALTGPGAYSVDALAGIALPEPATLYVAAALAALGTVAPFATRGPVAQATQVAPPAAG